MISRVSASLSTDDFLLLDAIHRGLEITARLHSRLPGLISRGFVKETEHGLSFNDEFRQDEAHDGKTGVHDEAHDRGIGVQEVNLGAHDEAHDEALDAQTEAHEPLLKIERNLLLLSLSEPQSTPALLEGLGYDSRTGNFKRALAALLERGFLERTIPDKPRSKHQRYRLTSLGQERLNKEEPTHEG